MSVFKNAYLDHQLKRWMAPNAHHFVRPDWRRHATPASDIAAVFELYEQKYSPDQPRVPAGSREGGQRWLRLSEQILRVDKWSVCQG